LNHRTEQNLDRTQLIVRLRRSIQMLLECRRRIPVLLQSAGMRKPNILDLFPVFPCTINTDYSPHIDGLCLTVRADDLREWMEKN
jgi:hypothetical protein